MLFCHAIESDVTAAKEILALFGNVLPEGELRQELGHGSDGDQTASEMIISLGYPTAKIPVTNLGIPLAMRRPSAGQL